MSLEETIKNLKQQIEEQEKKEVELEQEPEKEVEEVREPEIPEAKEEEKKEEEKKEEPKVEEAPKEEERPDNGAFARLRREKAAAEKRAQELEIRLQERVEAAKKDPEVEVNTQEVNLPPEVQQLVLNQRINDAQKGFARLEADFIATTPDYQSVAQEYWQARAQALKIQNPRLSNPEISELTNKQILFEANDKLERGFNPIEELYHDAKSLGFTGKPRQVASEKEIKEEAPKKELRPDLDEVAANRKRSSGMAGASGHSEGGQMTKLAAVGLPIEEWAKLSVEERKRIMLSA